MTTDPKVVDLMRRAWTIAVSAPDEDGDVEITITELPEFIVVGPPGPELNQQFWDAFSSYLASFTSRGAAPATTPPARPQLKIRQFRPDPGAAAQPPSGYGEIDAVKYIGERALATY